MRYSIARHYMLLLTIFLCHLSSMMFYLRSFLVVSSGALRNSWILVVDVVGSCNPTYLQLGCPTLLCSQQMWPRKLITNALETPANCPSSTSGCSCENIDVNQVTAAKVWGIAMTPKIIAEPLYQIELFFLFIMCISALYCCIFAVFLHS